MGNCQAAEAATVVIQHGDGKVERIYWSLSAGEVMAANPGHYVALIITTSNPDKNGSSSSSSTSSRAAPTVKNLRLLRPEDTLLIGHVYRLVSFEEVLKEFASKKHARLSKLLISLNKEKSSKKDARRRHRDGGATVTDGGVVAKDVGEARAHEEEEEDEEAQSRASAHDIAGAGRPTLRHSQWRPALQSIAEATGT
ncbi:hypothetical protein J5N97_015647 [Dioscorea zingiberensis]|uniref:Uncharacterized protein n=1 Tax=Dioscorea zingiberensis TaxID=325984 RepID=A0A9D5HEX0_9LILI|nr:hypothetical protein J5N97_015647 [Dioscorea zingiberensis]